MVSARKDLRRHGFDPWLGEFCMPCGVAKRKPKTNNPSDLVAWAPSLAFLEVTLPIYWSMGGPGDGVCGGPHQRPFAPGTHARTLLIMSPHAEFWKAKSLDVRARRVCGDPDT